MDTKSTDPGMEESFAGYHQAHEEDEDIEITHIGPGTPCGEFFRRYWHPVAVTANLGDLPL